MIKAHPSSWRPGIFPYGRRLDGRFPAGVRGEGNFLVPSMRVVEEDDAYVVVAGIPGAQREELEVALCGPVLRVCGERRARREGNGIASNGTERTFSRFQREITLAREVDAARIEARFENGVLTVTLPVVPTRETQEIASKLIQVQ